MPICAIPDGTWVRRIGETNVRPLAVLRLSALLSAALNLIVQGNKSNLEPNDLTYLANDKSNVHINLDKMTIHQALQLGEDPHSSSRNSIQRYRVFQEAISIPWRSLPRGLSKLYLVMRGEALLDENTWNGVCIPKSVHQSFKTSNLQKEILVKEIVLKAMGQTISKTVAIAEIIKLKVAL
ncbi:Uncharacterized protein Fot_41426 [Forsythia ovata]|uniref:DNA/RNA-binding protein Alba-like domain-containing protein n=1 Tax=Forsythia ovata TaxID=205694 RepID=A0ABD1RI76_9LAMI